MAKTIILIILNDTEIINHDYSLICIQSVHIHTYIVTYMFIVALKHNDFEPTEQLFLNKTIVYSIIVLVTFYFYFF